MSKIAYIFSSIYALSVVGINCDFMEHVKNVVEKNLENIDHLYIKRDESLFHVAVEYLNYPVQYWNEKGHDINTGCTEFPRPHMVHYENTYWQIFETSNGTFRLYNSYLDTRKLTSNPVVRILGMINRVKPQIKLYCLLWYDNSTVPIVVKVSEYMLIWHLFWLKGIQNANLPYLINCPAPSIEEDGVPSAVTLVEQPCQQTWNVLKVMYNKSEKKDKFAICVKGLDFPFWDMSLQLVEWIELNKLLGVDKVFFYNFQVHPNVQQVLDYYAKTGYAEVTPLTYSTGKPHMLRVAHGFRNEAKRFEQVIAYNDCWNKNMYKYEHISLLDIDELIVPVSNNTWSELLDSIEKENREKGGEKYASYVAREARFGRGMVNLAGVSSYMTMIRRVLRKEISSKGIQAKSIHDTEIVITLHNHYLVDAFKGHERLYEMDPSIAQVNHYRYCEISNEKCPIITAENGTVDVVLWKYYVALKTSMRKVFGKVDCLQKYLQEK